MVSKRKEIDKLDIELYVSILIPYSYFFQRIEICGSILLCFEIIISNANRKEIELVL